MKKLTAFLVLFFVSSVVMAGDLTKSNKDLVVEFYTEVFLKAQPEILDEYMGDVYIQHNPHVPDGKEAIRGFIASYLVPIVKGGGSIGKIIRVIAEDDLVVVHAKLEHYPSEKGGAVVDIFRVENGKIVEHWDVAQELSESSVNSNGVF